MQHDDHKLKLYLTHRAALIDYATPLVGDRTRAEDVVQEAFIRFGRTKAELGRSLVEQQVAYLYRIVRNLALDWTRRRGLEARHQKGDPVYWTVPAQVRTPEQDLVYLEELRRVDEALAELSETARLAVELHRFDGHTLQEVADRLGLPLTSTHRLIKDAVVHVARRIGPVED